MEHTKSINNNKPADIGLMASFRSGKRKFDKVKNAYIKCGLSFELEFVGSITKINFADGTKRRMGSFVPKKGMFISQITSKNVRKRLNQGLYVPINKDPERWNTNTIMYNPENIRLNVGKPAVSVDIVGCYWQTAYNLGVIDKDTWEKGLRMDREYKEARNIAIGGLGAQIVKEKYVEGRKVSVERTRRFGACVRLDIIDHVFAMAQRIGEKLGSDFMMFLTDCFYVPAHRYEDLCKYIEAEGYKFKKDECEFGGVDRLWKGVNRDGEELFTERVVWYNYEQNKFKHHNFNQKHVYDFSSAVKL